MKIAKLEGCGNDFILSEDTSWPLQQDKPNYVRRICHRKLGVGADGFVFLEKQKTNYVWDFYNADGSPAEMCGNAVRCVGRYLYQTKNETLFDLKTIAGTVSCEYLGGDFSVDMGKAVSTRQVQEGVYFINTGVPHIVCINKQGKQNCIDNYRSYNNGFDNNGCNVTFLNTSTDVIEAVSFERGVEDFTLACGTGAVAAAAVYFEVNKQNHVKIKMPGGVLDVRLQKEHFCLIGPANFVFKGEYNND